MLRDSPATVSDSRRLTGPSLLLDGPGAVMEVHHDEQAIGQAVAAWELSARRLLHAVGWEGERVVVRRFAGGASLALTAPADVLYAATELNEAAWAAAAGEAKQEQATVAALRATIAAERNPRLLTLRAAAREHGVLFLAGEEHVSAGAGTGVRVWAETDLPDPEAVDWTHVHDVPVALVTGSNGKTTVTRLLAAMATEAGRVTGFTSTEGVYLRGEMLGEGDFSGPSGARLLLRQPALEVAVLETARGGLLRRGLGVDRATVAVVTNVADDHLGEYGIVDLKALTDVKLLVARAVGPRGAVVLNADDPALRARGERLATPVVWFTLDPSQPTVARHLAAGGRAAIWDDGALVLAAGRERATVARVDEVPITVGGAARHNVANALAALGAAAGLGLPLDAVGRALRRFGREGEDNAGRANVMDLGGVRLVIDYAHNPHGMSALARMIGALPGARRLVMLGQAGDRSDDAIRALARAALQLRPDRIVLKEMERYLRGRAPGEVPALMADELARQGVPAAAVSRPGTELAAVRDALAWARPGDVLLLAVHQDRPRVLELLDQMRGAKWRAGDPVP
ncbi:MAG: Mur ligase family protein [Gemmatimonadales bacterium]